MDNNFGTDPFAEPKSKSPIITIVIIGFVLAGCCVVFIGAFFLFKPDQLPLVDQFFPSATPTLTKTPSPTPTPNLTATQRVIQSTGTAQAIQALATDSFSQWPVLFSETFDSNKNDWTIGKNDGEYASVSREIKDGKYSWDVTSKKGVIAWVAPDIDPVSDFHLSADFKRTSGSDQFDYGLVFREDSDSNLYYFGIDHDGYFVLLSYNNEWTDMIEYTRSPIILSEETNRLTVIAEGSHFTFFINGQYIDEMINDTLSTGTTAIAVEMYEADLQATFEFDNFELRAP